MKFIHLSDLHIGKRVGEVSMLNDQVYILNEIIGIIDEEKPDAVLISGDVYDKKVPAPEAVSVLDDFIYRLSEMKLDVFIISGNHDSPERLSFGGRLIEKSGVHLSPVYNGEVVPVELKDEYGEVFFWMLPFVRPVNVRECFKDEKAESYTDAVSIAIKNMHIDKSKRNVLLTHQFITNAEKSGSEEIINVGGTDNVDASVFDDFDYVALGHIHKPQNIIEGRIRYCGTPLKYSFSEANDKKSVTVVEMEDKNTPLNIRTIPLTPKHDMRIISNTYAYLTQKKNYENTAKDDYMHIILTDEEEIPEAIGKLQAVYPNVLKLTYDNKRTRSNSQIDSHHDLAEKTPLELFGELYFNVNNNNMSDEQKEYMSKLIEDIWEGEK